MAKGENPVDTRRRLDFEELMRKQDPGADHYHAGVYQDTVFCEVWREGSAKVYTLREDDGAPQGRKRKGGTA